jgi:hypothetical protein
MALMPRPFAASPNQLPVVSSAPLRRCTFRRVTAVGGRASEPTAYQVACMFPDRRQPIALGNIEHARPICEACTAKGIFRADSD